MKILARNCQKLNELSDNLHDGLPDLLMQIQNISLNQMKMTLIKI